MNESEVEDETSLLVPEITMMEEDEEEQSLQPNNNNSKRRSELGSNVISPRSQQLPPMPALKFVGRKRRSQHEKHFSATINKEFNTMMKNPFNAVHLPQFTPLPSFIPPVSSRHPLVTRPHSVLFGNGIGSAVSVHNPPHNGFDNAHFFRMNGYAYDANGASNGARATKTMPPLISLNKKHKTNIKKHKSTTNDLRTINRVEEHEVVEIDDDEVAHIEEDGNANSREKPSVDVGSKENESDDKNRLDQSVCKDNRRQEPSGNDKALEDHAVNVSSVEATGLSNGNAQRTVPPDEPTSSPRTCESIQIMSRLLSRSSSSPFDEQEEDTTCKDKKSDIIKARKLFRPRITVKLKAPQKYKKGLKKKKKKSDKERHKESIKNSYSNGTNNANNVTADGLMSKREPEAQEVSKQGKPATVMCEEETQLESSSIATKEPSVDTKPYLPKAKKSFNGGSATNVVTITSYAPSKEGDQSFIKRRLSLSDVIQNQKRLRVDQKSTTIVSSNIIRFQQQQKVRNNTDTAVTRNFPTNDEEKTNSDLGVARISSFKNSNEVLPSAPSSENTPSKSCFETSRKEYTLPNGKKLGSAGLLCDLQIEELHKIIEAAQDKKSANSRSTTRSMNIPARKGDNVRILQQLELGSNVNQRFTECDNSTALHVAAMHNHVLTAHILVQCEAEINSCDQNQNSPLMLASMKNNWQMVSYLLRAGADVCVRGECGMTALHLAAKEGSTEACHALLSHVGTPKKFANWRDDGGWTPLVWACENKREDTIKYLVDRGTDVLLTDNEGNNALHWAALSGSLYGCELLISAGCDVNAANNKGDTPLHISLRRDNDESSTLFLMRKADIEVPNEDGLSPEDCSLNSTDISRSLVRLRSLLKRQQQRLSKAKRERTLSTDLSKGKERHAVECVNEEDNAGLPAGYVYVKGHCFASRLHVDRDISKLICVYSPCYQHCDCDDDECSSEAKCRCSDTSVRTWYDARGRLIDSFNFSQPPTIFECNDMCSCHVDKCHNRVVQYGMDLRLQVFRTKNMGWGVRPLDPIAKGTFVCEYAGEIIPDQEAETREDSYLFDIETKEDITYCIDANAYGNVSRFINHSCSPNLTCVKVFTEHQDVCFPHIAFFANRNIERHEELGYDYGDKFWVIKHTQFTCHCNADTSCKYNEANIEGFLKDFQRRHGGGGPQKMPGTSLRRTADTSEEGQQRNQEL